MDEISKVIEFTLIEKRKKTLMKRTHSFKASRRTKMNEESNERRLVESKKQETVKGYGLTQSFLKQKKKQPAKKKWFQMHGPSPQAQNQTKERSRILITITCWTVFIDIV